ncbi:MAG: RNA methyltransferase [Bacilli bacterium]|nr:RNA methyltransferase [Bacilli bacterium]
MISSVDNSKIKDLAKLNQKKYRDLTGKFLVEGDHLVEEAYKAGVLEELFVLESSNYSYDVPITTVTYEVLCKLSSVETPTDVIGLCHKKDSSIVGNKLLLLDCIQDPGNLGTIIRSSVAFGIDTIVLSLDTVDLYNPKVIRSTQGMFFHTNVVVTDLESVIADCKNNGITVYGTNVNGGVDVRSLTDADIERFALIMGNEGNGVRDSISSLVDKNLYIPMNSAVESLNVGVATSILLYEMGRIK